MDTELVQRVLMGGRKSNGSTKRVLGQTVKSVKLLGATTKSLNKLGTHTPSLNGK